MANENVVNMLVNEAQVSSLNILSQACIEVSDILC